MRLRTVNNETHFPLADPTDSSSIKERSIFALTLAGFVALMAMLLHS